MKKIILVFSVFFILTVSGSSTANCPFCQEEVIERQLFYQGDEVLGIMTYKPAKKGHLLIIPTRHVERYEDLTPSEISEMGEVIKKVNQAVRTLYGTTGYILVQKNGSEAGQSVPHVHFHYLPCKEGESQFFMALKFFTSPWQSPLSAEEMKLDIALLEREMSLSSDLSQ